MNGEMNRYTMMEYIERVSSIGKRKDREAYKKEASKIKHQIELEESTRDKPDQKAYERFKRKAYTVGGEPIESRRKQCEK